MMNKRILLIYAKNTSELLNRESALGSYIFCLSDLLQRRGLDLFVNGESFNEIKKQKYSKGLSLTKRSDLLKRLVPNFFKELLKDLILFKKNRKLFGNIAETNQYDCVLEFYNYGSNIGFKISKYQKIPLVVIYDAPVLEEYIFFHGPKLFFKNEILKRELKTLQRADKVIAYSNAVKDYLIKISGKELDVAIHQNVDFTRFDFLEEKTFPPQLNIGFIGSFLKWHRIDLLLQAFNRLKENDYSVELFLIGNGMEHSAMKKSVDRSAYKDFIKMPGFMDGRQLLDLKEQLHIGVMPGSNWYGAPNKIFEYGAAKMAVVAPNTPTIADLFIDNKELLLFKHDDAEDLYDKLKLLCDDRILAGKLAATLQLKIRDKYSEKNTASFYENILSGAMKIKVAE